MTFNSKWKWKIVNGIGWLSVVAFIGTIAVCTIGAIGTNQTADVMATFAVEDYSAGLYAASKAN